MDEKNFQSSILESLVWASKYFSKTKWKEMNFQRTLNVTQQIQTNKSTCKACTKVKDTFAHSGHKSDKSEKTQIICDWRKNHAKIKDSEFSCYCRTNK